MNRILFVDDEPGILDGLRNSLRRQRHRWEMVFVASGTEALRELEKAPCDLVVTDMRMPLMDGAELLRRVKAGWPATARIVLSGQAEQEAILRTLPVAHQFLCKPCDPEQLSAVIDRSCRLGALLNHDPLRRAIGALDSLPCLPRHRAALEATLARPGTGLAEVGAIVERDPALSVKLLQLVNSGYFGSGGTQCSIRQAVTYLGLELLRTLVTDTQVFATPPTASGGMDLEPWQRHSLRMARLMRRFFAGEKLAEEAYALGLIHDVGEVVLAAALAGPHGRSGTAPIASGATATLREPLNADVGHAEVGAYLLGIWGLPLSMVEAVTHHHRPSALAANADCRLLAALHTADALLGSCAGEAGAEHQLDTAFLARAVPASLLEQWRRIAMDEAEEEIAREQMP
ncbi:MAG: HDOD domain-containing protein [Stagnimonas sp.]|nr:HDOD domain-containing protein [Stagnimonas sp.]